MTAYKIKVFRYALRMCVSRVVRALTCGNLTSKGESLWRPSLLITDSPPPALSKLCTPRRTIKPARSAPPSSRSCYSLFSCPPPHRSLYPCSLIARSSRSPSLYTPKMLLPCRPQPSAAYFKHNALPVTRTEIRSQDHLVATSNPEPSLLHIRTNGGSRLFPPPPDSALADRSMNVSIV